MLITGAALLSLLIWLYLLLARGAFWRVGAVAPAAAIGRASQSSVAVIVPARNEAAVVGESVRSLLSQTGAHGVHLFLVDDGSTDTTAQIARAAAVHAGKPEALTIISGAELPQGWSGKVWAMEQGLERAQVHAPDFYLFTDADVVHAPDSIATLITIAGNGPYDLVSFMVKLHCGSFAEKLLVPAFVFFFFMLYPPKWIADGRRKMAGAAGGCILLRRESLERASGLAPIRGEIIDDCALAARIKAAGGRLWLGLSAGARSVRPYEGFAGIGRMISRTAFNQLGHSSLMLVVSLVGLALVYLAPPLFLFSNSLISRFCGAAACIAMVAAYLPTVRFYRLTPFWALTLPAAALFYIGATFHSAYRFWAGQGGEWKGRVQDPQRKKYLKL